MPETQPNPETDEPSDSETAEPSAPAESLPSSPPARHALRAAAGCGCAYVLFLQLVQHAPEGSLLAILVTTLVSLAFNLYFAVSVARGLRSNLALTLTLLFSVAMIAPGVLIPLLVRLHPEWSLWQGVAVWFKTYRIALHAVPGVDSLIMVACASSIGVLVSRTIREFKMLMPIAVVLALVDLYVVFGGGLVTQAKKGNEAAAHLMSSLTVKLPTVHPVAGLAPMQLAVGFADFLFIALFFACFTRFQVPSRKTFILLCVTLGLYMLFVACTGAALPALVPIAVVVLGMNMRRFDYKRDELFALLYAGLIVLAAGAFITFRSHSSSH